MEIRELDSVYTVGLMLVPRLRTDQALAYTISVDPLPPPASVRYEKPGDS